MKTTVKIFSTLLWIIIFHVLIINESLTYAKNINANSIILNKKDKDFIRRCENRGCDLQRIKSQYFKKILMYKPHNNSCNCFFLGAISFLNDSTFFFYNGFEDSINISKLNELIKSSDKQNFTLKEALETVQEICALSERYSLQTKEELLGQKEVYSKGKKSYIGINLNELIQENDSTIFITRPIEENLDQALIRMGKGQGGLQKKLLIILKINFTNGYPKLCELMMN